MLKALVRAVRDSRAAYGLFPRVVVVGLRCLHRSLRVQHLGREHIDACLARGERVIVAFWHGQLLLMPFMYPGRPASILISQHRDGEYIARMAMLLGFQVIRGSATRRGTEALREMMEALRAGRHAVITPDGPKGPRREAKPGVVELARLSGMPIVPVAFAAARAWVFHRSWDRFLVPRPGSPAAYAWGAPIRVPAETPREELSKYQRRLGEALDALTAEAEACCAAAPGSGRQ
ncbi:MAG TPA: lysophospholipid acyltransferase family protein [Candidatus Sulfotelmatobacter sp.]|nr:lysophospholipid acyltransferase family protein [Candidatus Sulfotelmatobacter sp.]